MCDEDGHETNTYMAHKFLEELRGVDFSKKLTEEEVMGYTRVLAYNNEADAGWLSGGIKDVRGLVKLLVDIVKHEDD